MLALAPQTIDLTPEKLTPQQLEGINHWTIANLPTQLDQLLQIPSLTILGTSPTAIALAQALQTLGKRITIVTTQPSLLPHLQPKIQSALQTQLQAQGITLYLNTTIQTIIQTTANNSPVTLKTNQGEITNDGLILGNSATMFNNDQLNQLNLAAVRVRRQGQTICVDRYGRASRKIYVCDVNSAQIGCDETMIVDQVLHALKLPALSPAAPPAITVALTNPTLVTIGLSAIQAKKRYGSQIIVFSRSLNTQLKAQVLNQTNGICELIVRSNGTIVGAQIFAAQAEEWTGILTLAIQQKIAIQSLAACPLPTGSFAELVNDLAREYRFRKANQTWSSKFIESWFAWLREISN
jgi:pyruvate/2-oxoglutarate dehydrogenase complex dihydrolipoamide dehydrogenase (E3) component